MDGTMRPENQRILRKGLRASSKRVPTGRKSRPVKTTIGRRRRWEMFREEAARRASEILEEI